MQWIMYMHNTRADTQTRDSAKAQHQVKHWLSIEKFVPKRISHRILYFIMCAGWNGRRKQCFTQKLRRVFGSGSLSIATHRQVHMFVCAEYTNPHSPTIVRKIIIESLLRYVSLHHFGASPICSFPIRTKCLLRSSFDVWQELNEILILPPCAIRHLILLLLIHKLNESKRLNKHLFVALNWGLRLSLNNKSIEQTMRIGPRKNLWMEHWEDTKSWYFDNAFWTLQCTFRWHLNS